MDNDKRIYVVVPETIQTPLFPYSDKPPLKTVIQPAGRQIAQACHVTSKLRWTLHKGVGLDIFGSPITTIILQARDSAEMGHVFTRLALRKLIPVMFYDDNPEYGPGNWPTAIAVYATPKAVRDILGYLPLWGSK